MVGVAVLTLAMTGCQMRHLPQEAPSESDSPAESVGGEPEEPLDIGADPPTLAIADGSAAEGDGTLSFTVSLSSATGGPVTVRYASEDGTATAGADYAEVSGVLTFPVGTSAAQSIEVAVINDAVAEPEERFTIRLSDAQGARLATATATGNITDDDRREGGPARPAPPRLAALQVTGGASTMYPAFAPEVLHYAVTCADPTTLQVSARASLSGTRLTLLRADPDDAEVSSGSLDAQVTVSSDHDLVIELGDGSATYVVHCIPADFPVVSILEKTEQVSTGLLLVSLSFGIDVDFIAMLDNNGVPRFHRRDPGIQFQPHSGGPLVDGRQVRYSVAGWPGDVKLLDRGFDTIRTVSTVGLTNTDNHDFLVTDDGTYLFIAYEPAVRDYSDYGGSATQNTYDAVIQEVTVQGSESFLWNSWDHRDVMQLGDDCTLRPFGREYTHLNSLDVTGGYIVASFRGCSQVLRIDGTTGAVEWKVGGSAPPEDSATTYLQLSGDPAGEFCGQHAASLSADGALVLFDNGTLCLGDRKNDSPFTRVVEYDVSSATQAVYRREYRQPAGQGYSDIRGGVTVLENGRWLIAWGSTSDRTVPLNEAISVSEVDPATGTAHLHLHLSRNGKMIDAYRVYRERVADVPIPPNLP